MHQKREISLICLCQETMNCMTSIEVRINKNEQEEAGVGSRETYWNLINLSDCNSLRGSVKVNYGQFCFLKLKTNFKFIKDSPTYENNPTYENR